MIITLKNYLVFINIIGTTFKKLRLNKIEFIKEKINNKYYIKFCPEKQNPHYLSRVHEIEGYLIENLDKCLSFDDEISCDKTILKAIQEYNKIKKFNDDWRNYYGDNRKNN